jgi:dihydrofolate reductase
VPKVITALSTSLDGFIAGRDDNSQQPLGRNGTRLFDWYADGDTPSEYFAQFRMSGPSAAFFDHFAGRCGAVITGRRTYDISKAWAGSGALPGVPLFVLTHRVPADPPPADPPYTFVTRGMARAVAQAKAAARDKDVSVMGSAGVQQALQLGLLDEIHVHLVPVLLGGGVRLLDHLGPGPIELEAFRVVDAPGVTHLSYRVVQ